MQFMHDLPSVIVVKEITSKTGDAVTIVTEATEAGIKLIEHRAPLNSNNQSLQFDDSKHNFNNVLSFNRRCLNLKIIIKDFKMFMSLTQGFSIDSLKQKQTNKHKKQQQKQKCIQTQK